MSPRVPITVTCQQAEPHKPHSRLWMGFWLECPGDHERCAEKDCNKPLQPTRLTGELSCPTHGAPWRDPDTGRPRDHQEWLKEQREAAGVLSKAVLDQNTAFHRSMDEAKAHQTSLEKAQTAGEAEQSEEWRSYRRQRRDALSAVLIRRYGSGSWVNGLADELEQAIADFMSTADMMLSRALNRTMELKDQLVAANKTITSYQQLDDTDTGIIDANEEMGEELTRLARLLTLMDVGVEGQPVQGEKIVDTIRRILELQADRLSEQQADLNRLENEKAELRVRAKQAQARASMLQDARGLVQVVSAEMQEGYTPPSTSLTSPTLAVRLNEQEADLRGVKGQLSRALVDLAGAQAEANYQRGAKKKWKARAGNWARSVEHWRDEHARADRDLHQAVDCLKALYGATAGLLAHEGRIRMYWEDRNEVGREQLLIALQKHADEVRPIQDRARFMIDGELK